MSILGIDEAGRGCVIGPLVVAGVLATEEQMSALGELGVRDSKKLTRTQRESLSSEIARSVAKIVVVEIPPADLEENLTVIELGAIARMISESAAHKVILDLPVGPRAHEKFVQALRDELGERKPEIVAENRADVTYPIVSAASIIAKVSRDRVIARLREHYGDFGWGYPSELKTRSFLKEFYERTGRFPDCARRKWRTLQDLADSVLRSECPTDRQT